MARYEIDCPICDETLEKDFGKEVDDAAIPLMELRLQRHITDEHSKRQMVWHAVRVFIGKRLPWF